MENEKMNENPLSVVKNEEEPMIEDMGNVKKNKPTPEETQKFKEEFEAEMLTFSQRKYKISDVGQFAANDTAIFLIDYLKKYALWTKTGWMGVIKMHGVLNEELKKNNEETGLCLDYQALEFCGYMLVNSGAIGLEAAIEFEKIADKYSQIMIKVGEQVEIAREELRSIQYLQEKWAAAEQGFYLAELEPKEDMQNNPKESNDNERDLGMNDDEK